jgi:hypothetical protein
MRTHSDATRPDEASNRLREALWTIADRHHELAVNLQNAAARNAHPT